MGVAPEEISIGMPHLTLAQTFGALTYYSDHQEEINRYIEQKSTATSSKTESPMSK